MFKQTKLKYCSYSPKDVIKGLISSFATQISPERFQACPELIPHGRFTFGLPCWSRCRVRNFGIVYMYIYIYIYMYTHRIQVYTFSATSAVSHANHVRRVHA